MDSVQAPASGYARYRGVVKIILWIVIFIVSLIAFLFYPAFVNRDIDENAPLEYTGERP